MKVIRATHLGMCFGVRDAITLATREADSHPVTILGELVHNETVNQSLRARGVTLESQLENVTTSTVIITAHGASRLALSKARARGHDVLEATCPLVHYAHRALMELVWDGLHPVIIGKRDHVEVRGMTEDLGDHDVVLTEENVIAMKERPRFGVVSQTTQPIDKVHALVALIRERFPNSEVRFKDTVCQPTKQRQLAAVELAKQCDIVVVVGGNNSNNTRELTETCSRHCSRVVQVQNSGELRRHWFYNAETVGITAGTSTPDDIIDTIESQLNAWTNEQQHVA